MGDGGGGYWINKGSSAPKEWNRKLPPGGQRQKDINSSLDLGQMPSVNNKDRASPQHNLTHLPLSSPSSHPPQASSSQASR